MYVQIPNISRTKDDCRCYWAPRVFHWHRNSILFSSHRHLNQPIQINRKSKLYNFKWLLFAIGLHNVCAGDCGILTLFRIIVATAHPSTYFKLNRTQPNRYTLFKGPKPTKSSDSIQKLEVQLNWPHGARKLSLNVCHTIHHYFQITNRLSKKKKNQNKKNQKMHMECKKKLSNRSNRLCFAIANEKSSSKY